MIPRDDDINIALDEYSYGFFRARRDWPGGKYQPYSMLAVALWREHRGELPYVGEVERLIKYIEDFPQHIAW